MLATGLASIWAFRIYPPFHPSNFNRLQAGPAQPDFGDTSGRQANTNIIAVVGDPLCIRSAKGLFRRAHDFPSGLRNDDVGLIGLRFGQGLPAHVDQAGQIGASDIHTFTTAIAADPSSGDALVIRWSWNRGDTASSTSKHSFADIHNICGFYPDFHIRWSGKSQEPR
ncbi:hypothetical protein D3C85_1304730 [compost metagenome]